MTYEVLIKELPAQPTLAIRRPVRRGAVGAALGEMLPAVRAVLERAGVAPAGPPYARFDAVDDEVLDLEAGVPVAEALRGDGEVVAGELPAGPAAVTWHPGPYEGLPEAHRAILDWLADQGRRASGVSWEVYWTDPADEPDPTKWQTEVVQPLA